MIGPTCERAFLTRTTVYRAREICIGIVSADVVLAGTDFGGARLRFARDSPLERSGFALVWGFSCQTVVLGCADSFLFGAGKAVFRARGAMMNCDRGFLHSFGVWCACLLVC